MARFEITGLKILYPRTDCRQADRSVLANGFCN